MHLDLPFVAPEPEMGSETDSTTRPSALLEHLRQQLAQEALAAQERERRRARALAAPTLFPEERMALATLTPRELEVFLLACEGLSSPAIAARLYIGVRTVETHRSRAGHKLGTPTPVHMVRFAVRHGLIDP